MYKKVNIVSLLGLAQFFAFEYFGVLGLASVLLLGLMLVDELRIGLLVITLLVGFRYYYWNQYDADHLIHMNDDGQLHELRGKICFEPDLRREDVRYIVCTGSGKFLVKANLYPRFEYGDEISLMGMLETPFEEKEFSYRKYLRIFNVDSVLQLRSSIDLVEQNMSFFFYLFKFKNWVLKTIEYRLMEPASSLVAGLLLGVRKGFSDPIMEQFNVTGLTHIIAVSGYNVSLIILVFNILFGFIPRQIRFYLIGAFLFSFMALTGFTASVIRAVIMGVISLAALEVGSKYMFFRAILLTALAMAFWNPAFLLYDAGFHLSFLATIGVVYLAQYLKFNFIPDVLGLREAFVLTVAAQIATMPILIYNFGRISLVSPFANLLVAPLIPICMLFGFLVVLFSFSQVISFVLVLIVSTVSYYLFLIIEYSAKVPIASVEFEKGNIFYVVAYFGVCLFFILRRRICADTRLSDP